LALMRGHVVGPLGEQNRGRRKIRPAQNDGHQNRSMGGGTGGKRGLSLDLGLPDGGLREPGFQGIRQQVRRWHRWHIVIDAPNWNIAGVKRQRTGHRR
jgi:hypothetical protein